MQLRRGLGGLLETEKPRTKIAENRKTAKKISFKTENRDKSPH